MSDIVHKWEKETEDAVRQHGLNPGDFVTLSGWDGDLWHEVKSVWLNSEDGRACSVYKRDGSHEYTFAHSIVKIHRANDPWDHNEVAIVCTKDGVFGRFNKADKPLPDRFLYQGTYTINVWLWNYCGKNVRPKKEKSLEPFLQALGISGVNVPWTHLKDIIDSLRCIKIKGWHPLCGGVPEQTFNKSIRLFGGHRQESHGN